MNTTPLGRPASAAIALLALSLLLSGCSDDTDTDTDGPTQEQYRAAIQAEADCVAAEGFQVSDVELRPDGYTYGYVVTSTNGTDSSNVMIQCATDLGSADITNAYLQSIRLSDAERGDALIELAACLEDAGMTAVPTDPSESTVLVKLINQQLPEGEQGPAWDCMDRYRLAWPPGDPNFS